MTNYFRGRWTRRRLVPGRSPTLFTARKSDTKWCPLPNVREWVEVSETCVTCPEYQERFHVPGVSRGEKECRFEYEWHVEVDRRSREHSKKLTNLGWGYMDPDVLQEVLEEQTSEWEPPKESEESVIKSIREVFRGPDAAEDGSECAENEENEDEHPELENEEDENKCW